MNEDNFLALFAIIDFYIVKIDAAFQKMLYVCVVTNIGKIYAELSIRLRFSALGWSTNWQPKAGQISLHLAFILIGIDFQLFWPVSKPTRVEVQYDPIVSRDTNEIEK